MEFIKKYKLTTLSFIGILAAVLMPGSDVPSVGIPNIDKAVHFGMFGVITLCYNWEYYKQQFKLPAFWPSNLSIVIFGACTEIMQYFVPGRSCDIRDLIADSIGIFVMSALFITYKRRKAH